MSSPPYTGKCICGAVSLKISSAPVAILNCFCKHCRKGAGGTHRVVAKFALKDVDVSASEENLTKFSLEDTSSGAPKEKCFCRVCGTPLWTVPDWAKGSYLVIRTGVIDEGEKLQPQQEIFTKYRPAWMAPVEGAKQCEEMH